MTHGEDETIDAATRALVRDWPGLVATVEREVGPGGGWPEVRVSGTPGRLLDFLIDFHDDVDDHTLPGLIVY
jgi:hypothetical protein